MKRIINKLTNQFIRDDEVFDEVTEIALDVEPAQGLITPKWNGNQWIEGATTEKLAEVNTQRLAFTLSETNRTNIQDFLKTAITDNKDYITLTAPTTTQNTKQIKALTRQNNRMIRLLLNLLDSAD